MKNKKAQIGTEYMIVIGFLTFAIMSILAFAFIFSNDIKDRIRLNQVENFANQLIGSSESVFFAGEPSKTTIRLYLPDGVENITIIQNAVVITTSVSGGQINKRAFDSKVPLSGSLTPGEGIRRIVIEARSSDVLISQAS